MANTLDPMDLKQILSLHLDGLSNRKIGTTLGVSRNTINTYIRLFKASDHDLKTLLSFDNLKLEQLFTIHTTIDNERYSELMRYFDQMHNKLKQPGFTFQYHYECYRKEVKNPYSYTQFLVHYRKKFPKEKGSMKLEHTAAEAMFVDYAGKKLQIVNKDTGAAEAVEVFVAILPSSQYTYVEACASQKQEDFIRCCENALRFYGGVPKMIVSDNLKSAVTRSSKYEAQINRSFKDFARHYNCVINPTRTYSPQDKALVENAVHLTYQRIYYPMHEMTFFSLTDLNKEIQTHLQRYNDLLLSRKQASRKALFLRDERSHLKPLPDSFYQMKQYKRAKVQKMGYVYFSPDKSYYSVPYRYIGHHTVIEATNTAIEVYYNRQRIAIHERNPTKGAYNTIKDHLSSTHQQYLDWSPEYFENKAKHHGAYVAKCATHIMANVAHPEIGYKRVMGLIQLHKNYSSERLNNACKKALELDMVNYKRIENILKNNIDKHSLFYQSLEEDTPHIPIHDNIRGASTYK
jgi:transposase